MPQVFRHALPLATAALAVSAISMARPAAAQYAAGANVGLSVVPITTGPVRVSADAGVGRNMSWSAPRTLLSLGTMAVAGTDAGGVSLGLFAQRTVEADSLSPVFALRAAAWHSIGPITLRLGLAEHALRFAGQPGTFDTVEVLVDSIPTDSGWVQYHGARVDTIRHPGTPSGMRVWSELEAGAQWVAGRVQLEAVVGARPPIASFPAAMWAQAGGSIDLPHGFGLQFAAGTSPARIGLGIPSSRFVSVGLRVQPRQGSPPVDSKPPAPIRAFTVRPDGGRRFTLTYAAAHAGMVQLSGDFNAWTPINLAEDGHGRWRATISLAPGVHHVSLRVNDGPWFAPPGTPAVADDFGGTTGIIDVP
jgi:hypothetical protein